MESLGQKYVITGIRENSVLGWIKYLLEKGGINTLLKSDVTTFKLKFKTSFFFFNVNLLDFMKRKTHI